jgi:hypothetical protein
VVFGVEILALFSGNDAARAAVPTPGCLDGVFPVIAAYLDGQALFEIAEDDAVPVVGEGAAFLDQGERLPCFPGQLADGDGVDNPLVAAESKCASPPKHFPKYVSSPVIRD